MMIYNCNNRSILLCHIKTRTRFPVCNSVIFLLFNIHGNLTQSLNKGQKICTMVRELSMTQVAHVGPYQAQIAHIPFWGREGPWGGSGGVQSLKIGHF